MNDINTYLTKLSKRLSNSTEDRRKIDSSYNYLEGKIFEHFRDRIEKVLVFGSYDRETELHQSIDSSCDVDVLVIFKTNEYQPQTLLKHLQEFADKIYRRSEVSPDHPAVTVILSHIRFELVPAYWHRNSFSADELKIPAPRSKELKWISTDPARLKTELNQKNEKENQLIIPLIRLVKYLNVLKGKPYESYRIERHGIQRSYSGNDLKDYFFKFIDDLFTRDQTESQIKFVEELKMRRERLKVLENGKMPEYAIEELQKFLPFPE